MITTRSRYANTEVALVNSTRGPVLTITPRQPETRTFNFTYVALEEFDRLDLMASRLYGDARLWWRIADANPEILDWTTVTVGTILRVPTE